MKQTKSLIIIKYSMQIWEYFLLVYLSFLNYNKCISIIQRKKKGM